jgi:hypothetical protein
MPLTLIDILFFMLYAAPLHPRHLPSGRRRDEVIDIAPLPCRHFHDMRRQRRHAAVEERERYAAAGCLRCRFDYG